MSNFVRLLWSGRVKAQHPADIRLYLYGRRSFWRSGKRA